MKIELDKTKLIAKLVKKDGTVISTYPYKKIETSDFSYADFENDINRFNEYLEKQEDFDNIKELLVYVNLFNFN